MTFTTPTDEIVETATTAPTSATATTPKARFRMPLGGIPWQRPRGAPPSDRRSTIALLVIALTQLMVVLDATIVNVALPHIQHALDFTPTGLSWVLNAYSLTFGGLLLLGARAGDILGQRRMLILGVLVFALGSFAGGFATSAGWLLAARALQGVGGAAASPAALAVLTNTFAEGQARTRALGLYSAVSVAGSGVGLVAGGMLTAWVSWRWVLFVNVPIAIVIAAMAPRYLATSVRRPGRFDLTGALTSTLGMSALVYGFIRAASDGWGDSLTVPAFAVGAILLGAFVVAERRASQPITPLRLFADHDRAASYLARLLFVGGISGMFFFLTEFMQNVLGYGALRTGFGFLPVTAALFVMSQLSARRLVPRFGPKPLLVAGSLSAAAGLVWLTQISPTTGYLEGVLGPMLLFGLGGGTAFVPLTMLALSRVQPQDAGAASGLVNAMQQIGGALGLSVLVTVFGSATRHEATHTHAASALAAAHHVTAYGTDRVFATAAIFTFATALVTGVAVRGRARRQVA